MTGVALGRFRAHDFPLNRVTELIEVVKNVGSGYSIKVQNLREEGRKGESEHYEARTATTGASVVCPNTDADPFGNEPITPDRAAPFTEDPNT